jgi:SOS-response transcriptional repressor LexA
MNIIACPHCGGTLAQGALTTKAQRLLDFARATVARRGTVPTYSEMAQQFGFKSKCSVSRLMDQLEERGYVQRYGKVRRQSFALLAP